MDENNRDKTESKSLVAEDIKWVFNNRHRLWVPQYQRRRWKNFKNKVPFEWLNLLGVLTIPFVVTFMGFYFTQQVTQQQTQLSVRQHQVDLQIANDQQQEATLKVYLDDMTTLLLDKKLGSQAVVDQAASAEAAIIARAKTLIALPRLNALQKATVVQFLYKSHLIGYYDLHPKPLQHSRIIDLSDADLSGADLSGADLSGADLSGADLTSADLSGAILNYVNLNHAHMSGAYLSIAHLKYVDLSFAVLNFAHLSEADLSYGKLNFATFFHADLSSATLTSADLSNADLNRANLRGVTTITPEQLAEILSLNGATLPDGSRHP